MVYARYSAIPAFQATDVLEGIAPVVGRNPGHKILWMSVRSRT
jgi:hypothetical protein